MSRLKIGLNRLKKQKRKALVAFVTAGFPSQKATLPLMKLFERSGVDIIELGVPFSDPIADGPTIQFSSQKALEKGMTLKKALSIVRAFRKKSSLPVLLMGYMNPFLRNGIDKTFAEVRASGADGLIIPDLIPETDQETKKIANKRGLSIVYFVAPNTPRKRYGLIDSKTDSFVYALSLTGVTGKRKKLPDTAKAFLKSSQRNFRHPKLVGFGISGPDQVREIKKYCNGIIVGSAIVEIIRKNGTGRKGTKRLYSFLSSLRNELDRN
ncbi:MAG: tryptophan synthase subunit alpha [Endomicrobiales bacterium]|nr:tryptophan synthase subunit alpha [Endomicrobiales bacterium]